MEITHAKQVVDFLLPILSTTLTALDKKPKQPLDASFKLYGQEGELDSLGLVNFIVAAEQEFDETFGVPVTLADERALSQRESPFRTIQSLAEYICVVARETADG